MTTRDIVVTTEKTHDNNITDIMSVTGFSRSAVNRPVYIESRLCVVKGVVKCSFEYLCVVRHDTCRRHNVGVGEGTIKKIAE